MSTERNSTRGAVDLTNCDREPIHVPGRIQPHGVLLVVDGTTWTVQQVSANADDYLGICAESLLGQPMARALGAEGARQLIDSLTRIPPQHRPLLVCTLNVAGTGQPVHVLVHAVEGQLVVELEPVSSPYDGDGRVDSYAQVDSFTLRAEELESEAELCALAAQTIRELTDFDRVLVYRFDVDWHGVVLGEAGNGRLPVLLHHRFPASDIPAQARELYRVSRIRIIPNASYAPVPLIPERNPRTGAPLNMSFSTLRSVSPMHVEYMKNMETAASMSVSILLAGRLWGLISCHNQQPRHVSFPIRATCDLVARAFSLRLSALDRAAEVRHSREAKSIFTRLFARMADQGDFAESLMVQHADLLAFTGAQGVAIVTDSECRVAGTTPSETRVRELAKWLFETGNREVFATDCLSQVFPPAAADVEVASGLLAIAISKLHPSYVLWFRPEVIQTIQWGGDPRKTVESVDGQNRIHPRQSFETWKETVRHRSLAWSDADLSGAADLRNALVGIVLRKAEEIAVLNLELTRSNRELEAFSYSVSHDLRAPLRHIVGYAEILRESAGNKLTVRDQRCIDTIIESSEYAGKLVEKLLEYSRLGRAELQFALIDMNVLVREIREGLALEQRGRSIEWDVADLPPVVADLVMIRMAVQDLLSNAVKYTRQRDRARIEIGGRVEDHHVVYWVKDNGVGFDMQYADKLFGVFQRLHRWEDFEGTGIGLANVQRVVERHGGQVWAEAREGQGATFTLHLPRHDSEQGYSDAQTNFARGRQSEGSGIDVAGSGEEQPGQ